MKEFGGNVAVICSEFNKELVESLRRQACGQFEGYVSQAQLALSSKDDWPLSGLESDKRLDFMQGRSDLLKRMAQAVSLQPAKKQKEPGESFSQLLKHFLQQAAQMKMELFWVPGAGEIPLAVKWAVESRQAPAVLALGALIRGQTAHYDFLRHFLERALWDLQKSFGIPIIFSILMTENRKQAEERIQRARGAEGMKALLEMMELRHAISAL